MAPPSDHDHGHDHGHDHDPGHTALPPARPLQPLGLRPAQDAEAWSKAVAGGLSGLTFGDRAAAGPAIEPTDD